MVEDGTKGGEKENEREEREAYLQVARLARGASWASAFASAMGLARTLVRARRGGSATFMVGDWCIGDI